MPEAEATRVVWWALVLGGLVGGFAKLLLDGQIVMPKVVRLKVTDQTVIVPGFLTPIFLGPIAAFVLAGAGAATFNFQTGFDPRGFWGPFIGSIPAGVGATYVLNQATRARLESAQENLLEEAEQNESVSPPVR